MMYIVVILLFMVVCESLVEFGLVKVTTYCSILVLIAVTCGHVLSQK
jgi:hypothetical protein